MALEICLREYFLKKKTLPAPLFRFFDLQRVLKERKIKELEDIEIDKQNEIDRAIRKKHREKEKLKLAGMLKGFEGEKQVDVDMEQQVISIGGEESTGDDGNKSASEKESEEADVDTGITEIKDAEESNKDDMNVVVQPIHAGEETATEAEVQRAAEMTGSLMASPGQEGDRPLEEMDPDAPATKPISQRFLTDPAYALIDRDYCVSVCVHVCDCVHLIVCLYVRVLYVVRISLRKRPSTHLNTLHI